MAEDGDRTLFRALRNKCVSHNNSGRSMGTQDVVGSGADSVLPPTCALIVQPAFS